MRGIFVLNKEKKGRASLSYHADAICLFSLLHGDGTRLQ